MIKPAAHVFYIGDEDLPASAAALAALYEVSLTEVEKYAALYCKDGVFTFRIGSQPPIVFLAQWHVPLMYFGEAVVSQTFDRFNPTGACKVVGMELSAQEAPTGAGLTIELVDGAGASLGRTITLAAGTTVARATFASLSLAANAIVRAKITAIGSTFAGAWLNLRLLVSL